MRRRGVLSLSVILGCSLALLTGSSYNGGTPPALADPWTPPTLPAGAADPWEAYVTTDVTKQYSASEMAQILKNRIAVSDYIAAPAVETADEQAYRLARMARISQLLRLAPSSEVLTAGRIAFYGSELGLLALTGYATYQLIQHFLSDGSENVHYLSYDRARIGGQEVTIPTGGFSPGYADGMHLGYDYQPCVAFGASAGLHCNNTTDTGYDAFGWYLDNTVDTSLVPSGHAWVFSYAMAYAIGCYKTGTCVGGHYYPYFPEPTGSQKVVTNRSDLPVDPNYCSQTNNTLCLGTASGSADNIGPALGIYNVPFGLATAAWKTVHDMEGQHIPQKIYLDRSPLSPGHLKAGDSTTTCTVIAAGGNCAVAYIPEGEMEVEMRPTSPGGDNMGTQTYNVPTDAGNATDRAKLRAIENPCLRKLFNWIIDPAHYAYPHCIADGDPPLPDPEPPPIPPGTFHPFDLPEPLLGETYTQYLSRLRALGWLGTMTRDLANDDWLEATAEPGSDYSTAPTGTITRLVVQDIVVGTQTAPVYTPQGKRAWPASPPTVETPTTVIQVRVKPPDSEVPPLPPPTPDQTGIDFSPITDIDFGCHFPFGFICYAQDVTDWFNVAPDAPEFDLSITGPSLAGSPTLNYDVDLNVMDDWAATWRMLLSIALWIGAVYALATRLLGFHTAGDPGEAIDDGLEGT